MLRSTRVPALHHLGRGAMRPLAAAALCAALVVAAPAQAQTIDDADTAGDMAVFTYDESGEEIVAAPDRALNDVNGTTLTHATRRIAIEVDYVDLKKKAGGEYQSLYIILRTDEGARRHVSLDAWRGHWSGETSMYDGRYRHLRCSVRHSIDYEANVIKVSFPRRCADRPAWVQARVGAVVQSGDDLFLDDALLDRALTIDDSRLALSERVPRGDAS